MSGHRSREDTQKAVQAKLGDTPFRYEQMAAVAHLYRAAAAVRQHLENSVLRGADLTWTSFVVLWVVWVWGEQETRRVAEEAGISKGTLTGVARTLQGRGLLERKAHPTDGRLALLSATPEGERLMARLLPEFNAEEAFVTEALSDDEAVELADQLHRIVAQVESHGEERRLELLDGREPRPRRSGRRAKRQGPGLPQSDAPAGRDTNPGRSTRYTNPDAEAAFPPVGNYGLNLTSD